MLLAQGTAGFSEGWFTVGLDLRGIFQRKCNMDIDRKTFCINQVCTLLQRCSQKTQTFSAFTVDFF